MTLSNLSATRCALFAQHAVEDYSQANRQSAISPQGWLEYLFNLFIPDSVQKQYSSQYDNFTHTLIDALEKNIADPNDYTIPKTLEFTVGANKVSYSHTPSHWYNGEVKVEVKITELNNNTTIATVDKALFRNTLTMLLLQKRTHHSAYQYALTREGKIDLRGADLNGYTLRHIDLRGANLAGVDVKYADLSSADLRGANLEKADMRHANLTRASLAEANLNSAWLSDANLHEAALTGAVCYKTKLWRAHLIGANLSHTDFTRADFADADLTCADLSHAKLNNACLRGTTLNGAQLAYATFDGTIVDRASFDNTTLRGIHTGPFARQVPVTEL